MKQLQTVEWGSGPVRFQLRTSDAQVLEAAQSVFSPWTPDRDATLTGTWSVMRKGSTLFVDPRRPMPDGSEPPVLTDPMHAVGVVEYAAITAIVEECHSLLAFHAALLSRNGRSIAVVGQSHSGKSTLATALWKSGWNLQTDDLTLVRGRTAIAGPRRVALRDECRDQVGDELWESVPRTTGYFRTAVGCLFQPMHIDGSHPQHLELAALFFLKRRGAPPLEGPAPLSHIDAAFALLPYTNLIRSKSFTEAFRKTSELTSEVRAWDLPRAPIAEMVATVTRLTDADA